MSFYSNCLVCGSSIEFGYKKEHNCTYENAIDKRLEDLAKERDILYAALEEILEYHFFGKHSEPYRKLIKK